LASTNAASTPEPRHWPTIIVGGIFFLVGALMGGISLWHLYDASRALEGERARGEVLRKAIQANRTEGSMVRPRYRIDYRYTPAHGESVSASSNVAPELFARLEPGAPVEVVYLPSDPSTHRVEGEARDLVVPIVLVLMGAFFAPVGAWLARNGWRTPPDEGRRKGMIAAWFAGSPVRAIGVFGLVFFGSFFIGGWFWLDTVRTTEELLELRGQAVEGTVLSKSIVRKRSGGGQSGRSSESTHYHVVYRFVADGTEVVGTSSLDASDWDRLEERGPIALVYAGGSPWVHRVGGDSAGWIVPILFLAVGGLGALGSGAAIWLRRPGSRRPAAEAAKPSPPPPAKAKPARPRGKHGWLLGAGIGAIFLFAGCAVFIEGVADLLTERRYASRARLADARILDKSMARAERGGRRSTEYFARYRFEAADGREAEGLAALEPAAWEAAKAGDRIRVRYLADEPRINRPAGEGGFLVPIIFILIGLVFAPLGALMAWGSWLVRRDP
jgi:hypothetical protein